MRYSGRRRFARISAAALERIGVALSIKAFCRLFGHMIRLAGKQSI